MVGGPGNDTYEVRCAGDVVTELADEGTDQVNVFINYTLGPNLENLILKGAAAKGTGNGLNNVIFGNPSANLLLGLDGDDTLHGGKYNDTLDGGPGRDIMYGGNANDVYQIDNAGDYAGEAANAGTDTVNATISDTLDANVESLNLLGAALNGTGNAIDNIINGNGNANTLQGLEGSDSLYGYDGNDTLNGGLGTDSLWGGPGNDTFMGGYGGDGLYGGLGADNLGGGADIDTLLGDAGHDTLNGGAGNDSLYGGADQDRFVFDCAGAANRDIIGDFSHADDTIVLKDILDGVADSAIAGLTFIGGVLNAGNYFAGAGQTGSAAGDPSGMYNDTSTGNLYYNPTGSIAGDAVLIATVGAAAAPSLDHTDFVYAA